MDESLAREFEVKERIHVGQITREWWEMIVLKDILDSPLGSSFVFKGGTALRLAYNSPRFSEDLDFSIIEDFSFSAFEKIARNTENKFSELKIKDLWPKHYTIIAEYRVKEPWLRQAFSIKVEISKRHKKVKYEGIVLSTPFSNIQVVGNVYTIDQILEEKKEALKTRTKPRDVFDMWYIGQKLRIPVDISKHNISLQELTQELRKYLPKNYWKVIPILVKGK